MSQVSDGNETNDRAPVSAGDENETSVAPADEPIIHVLKGKPTAEELAALISVLCAAGGGASAPAPAEGTRWGLPVDKLRYSPFSWQTITLLERTHMRR